MLVLPAQRHRHHPVGDRRSRRRHLGLRALFGAERRGPGGGVMDWTTLHDKTYYDYFYPDEPDEDTEEEEDDRDEDE